MPISPSGSESPSRRANRLFVCVILGFLIALLAIFMVLRPNGSGAGSSGNTPAAHH